MERGKGREGKEGGESEEKREESEGKEGKGGGNKVRGIENRGKFCWLLIIKIRIEFIVNLVIDIILYTYLF